MPVNTIGDMSQHFQSLRQTGSIKDRLLTLSKELSSGRVDDLAKHLRGDTGQIALVDREIAMIDTFDAIGDQLARTLAHKQTVLTAIQDEATTRGSDLLSVTASSRPAEVAMAEDKARAGFNRVAELLNSRFADRALFAGAAVDGASVANGEAMLAAIVTEIGGATDAASITAAIETWFDDPAGGFATMGYRGDTGADPVVSPAQDVRVAMQGRADDAALRDVLKASAFAAVSDIMAGSLDHATRTTLIRQSGEESFTAADGVLRLSARIGEDEQRVDEAATRRAAQRTAFGQARNAMVQADPFETAVLLQEVQQQLELHYTTTARLSRLSLVNYL